VDGHVINVFDSHNHIRSTRRPRLPTISAGSRSAGRSWSWGGELTIESMDLTYDPTVKFYEAPFPIKSNGGTLLIDDFERQRI